MFQLIETGDELNLREVVSDPINWGWPKVKSVCETVRAASLGLIGTVLSLKHTSIRLEIYDDSRSLILDRTADCGAWF